MQNHQKINLKNEILNIVYKMCEKQKLLEATHWACHSDLESKYEELDAELIKLLDQLVSL